MKAIEKQCAGCGKVFMDNHPDRLVPDSYAGPRPYGTCPDCFKSSFGHKEHTFVDGACSVCGADEPKVAPSKIST